MIDIRGVTPQAGPWLQLGSVETLQHAVIHGGNIYASQGVAGTATGRETIAVWKLNHDGLLINGLGFIDAGHGTLIGMHDGYLYLNWNRYARGHVKSSTVTKIKWRDPVKYQAVKPSDRGAIAVMAKFTAGYVIPILDEAGENVCLRRTDDGVETWTLRNREQAEAGRDKVLGKLTLTDPPILQGAAISGRWLYRLTGNTAGTEPCRITVYDLSTGLLAYVVDAPLGGPQPDGWKWEPEGIYVQGSRVWVGVTSKLSGQRLHRLHYYETDPSMVDYLHPPYVASEANGGHGVLSHIRKMADEITLAARAAGYDVQTVWGYNSTPDHNNKRCLDFMVTGSSIPGSQRVEAGNWIANYVWENRYRLGLNWQIWNRRIRRYQNTSRPLAAWYTYSGPSPHTDHVHIEIAAGSIYVEPPNIASLATTEDELPSVDDVWNADIIPAPDKENTENPTWKPGTYLRHIFLAITRSSLSTDKRLTDIEAKIDKLIGAK